MDHRGIVSIKGVIRSDNRIISLLEYIPGDGFLQGIMKWYEFDEDSVRKIMKQLLKALSFCQLKRIIHRVSFYFYIFTMVEIPRIL